MSRQLPLGKKSLRHKFSFEEIFTPNDILATHPKGKKNTGIIQVYIWSVFLKEGDKGASRQ